MNDFFPKNDFFGGSMNDFFPNGNTTMIPAWLGSPGCGQYVQQEVFLSKYTTLNIRMKEIQQSGGYIISLTSSYVRSHWETILTYTEPCEKNDD